MMIALLTVTMRTTVEMKMIPYDDEGDDDDGSGYKDIHIDIENNSPGFSLEAVRMMMETMMMVVVLHTLISIKTMISDKQ